MKKMFIISLLTLTLCATFGSLINQSPGYMLIAYKDISIEASLWIAASAFFIISFSFSAALLLLTSTINFPAIVRQAIQRRFSQRSQKQLQQSQEAILNGQWKKARSLLRYVFDQDHPPLNAYLLMIQVQQTLGNKKRIEYYVKEAQNHYPQHSSITIAEAKALINSQDFEQAIRLLAPAPRLLESHPIATQLLIQAYQQTQAWGALIELLPQFKKTTATEEYLTLEKYAYLAKAETLYALTGIELVNNTKRFWSSLPKTLKADSKFANHYVSLLLLGEQHSVAKQVVSQFLNKQWDDKLLLTYGEIIHDKPEKALKEVLLWAQEKENNHNVQLTLGRLYLANKQWDKALVAFEKSSDIKPSNDAYGESARLLKALDKNKESALAKNKQADLHNCQLPQLPLP